MLSYDSTIICRGRKLFKRTVSGIMLALLLIGMLALSFNIQPAKTEQATIVVPDDYPTIQEAINAAVDGDTVFVRNGTYYENVIVNRSIVILGEDKRGITIDGDGVGTGISVTADHVRVEGFSVQNCEAGIRVEGNENTVVSNIASSNGNNQSELETDLEVYQDYVSPLTRWYLHNLINGSYTGFFNITYFTPVISVHALGHEDTEELAIGLFYDENYDQVPQILEFVGYMYRQTIEEEKVAEVYLFDPPEGQYIIKVMGWCVSGNPGHFDLKIVRYAGYGIGVFSSFGNTVSDNLVMSNTAGLCLHGSENTTARINNATGNMGGIVGRDSRKCTLSENHVCMNDYGPGISLWSAHDNYISENNVSLNIFGICLWNSSRNELVRNNLLSSAGWGLGLHASDENRVSYNNMSFTRGLDGVRMMFASRNNITENYISHNNHAGTFLWLECDNNTIVGNEFYSNTQHGVELKFSDNNTIVNNKIAFNSRNGILIIESTGCSVKENHVFSNSKGIMFCDAFGNTIYHNSILDSWDQQGADVRSTNIWDAGYPLGGNYWSDHTEIDNYRGPNQNELGSDGINDIAYNVEESQDNYPLTKPYAGPHDIGIKASISKTIVADGYNTTLTINVTLINYGEQAETFNFTFQIPATTYEQMLTLSSRNSTTLTFTWNTTGSAKGNYTVEANVMLIPGETYTADNTNVKWVVVTIAGDVTSASGEPDGKVDMRDIGAICSNFGNIPSSPDWDPNMDVNDDDIVNMRDIGIACNNFMKT